MTAGGFSAFLAFVASALAGTSFAASPIEARQNGAQSANGALTLGYQGSDELNTGYGDVLQPLYSPTSHSTFFYDGRFSFDDDDQTEQSHGLVFRHRVPDHDVIFGANVYYDSGDDAYDQHHNQLGLGVEVLTKWVDFRANYYLPDQKQERVDRQSKDVRVTLFKLREEGTLIKFGPGGRPVTVPIFRPVLSEISLRQEFYRFESPLEGFDTELGFLIPGLNRYAEVRVLGGYHHYVNPYGRDFDGFQARLEARVRKGVTAEVEYSDDKVLNGGRWTGGVRVSLPFNLGNLFAGRNPFEGASEAFGPPSGDFGDRMSDLVIRSHRIKTATSGLVTTYVAPPRVTSAVRADTLSLSTSNQIVNWTGYVGGPASEAGGASMGTSYLGGYTVHYTGGASSGNVQVVGVSSGPGP
jgi:hypothetical protein